MYQAYVFDLDGTLYRGDSPIPGAVEVVAELRKRGAKIFFLTNNSSKTSQAFADTLDRMGFEARPEEVYGTGKGAALLLKQEGVKSAYVMGEKGLAACLAEQDIEVVNLDANGIPQPEGTKAEAVVAGICRHFSYGFLAGAMAQIQDGARFVATNRDSTYPMEGGKLIPGSGSLIAALETCSGVTPHTIGKPGPYLLELLMKDWDLQPEQTLVVGDRMDTDIDCGINAGCPTHLVLTGVTEFAPEGQTYSEDLSALL